MKWHVLEHNMWDQQFMKLSQILGMGSKLWDDQISKTDPKAKRFVVKKYFDRQLLESKLRFMQWYHQDQQRKERFGQVK